MLVALRQDLSIDKLLQLIILLFLVQTEATLKCRDFSVVNVLHKRQLLLSLLRVLSAPPPPPFEANKLT